MDYIVNESIDYDRIGRFINEYLSMGDAVTPDGLMYVIGKYEVGLYDEMNEYIDYFGYDYVRDNIYQYYTIELEQMNRETYFDDVSDIIQSMIDDYQWETEPTGRLIHAKLHGELRELRERYPYTTVSFDEWFIDWADRMLKGG